VVRVAKAAAHDYPLSRSVLPKVGGRLLEYASAWRSVTSDQWVLEVVASGYRLEFTDRPPSYRGVRYTQLPKEPAQRLSRRFKL
jgi:hypothetical protein